jgi:hypothetical protein
VFFQGFGPDNDVIEVDVAYLTDPFAEGIGYATLMDGRRISQAHGHDSPFIESEGGVHPQLSVCRQGEHKFEKNC